MKCRLVYISQWMSINIKRAKTPFLQLSLKKFTFFTWSIVWKSYGLKMWSCKISLRGRSLELDIPRESLSLTKTELQIKSYKIKCTYVWSQPSQADARVKMCKLILSEIEKNNAFIQKTGFRIRHIFFLLKGFVNFISNIFDEVINRGLQHMWVTNWMVMS